MKITILYSALLGLLFMFLSARTIRMRQSLKITVGDQGNKSMLRAMRVHANFAEYVPFSVFLIFLVEQHAFSVVSVHALGLCLLAGRLLHAFGVSQEQEKFKFRIAGMIMTFTVLVISSLFLIYAYFTK